MGFIMSFSYMYVMYFDQIHPNYPSRFPPISTADAPSSCKLIPLLLSILFSPFSEFH